MLARTESRCSRQIVVSEMTRGNKHRKCKSVVAADGVTLAFGSGKLDDDGYWEIPCIVCAMKWKGENPGAVVWPESDDVVCDPT